MKAYVHTHETKRGPVRRSSGQRPQTWRCVGWDRVLARVVGDGGIVGVSRRAQTGMVPLQEETRAELVWMLADFDRLVTNAAEESLDAPTNGTRWTNRQLPFHMWFGQRIARVFIPLIGGFSRLPPIASRAWARLLTAVTKPYECVNYGASAAGGRIVPLTVTPRWMKQDTVWLLRWADRALRADPSRGMSVAQSWDPYFPPWMSRADLLAWAPKHHRHHRAQLTLDTTPTQPGTPRSVED